MLTSQSIHTSGSKLLATAIVDIERNAQLAAVTSRVSVEFRVE